MIWIIFGGLSAVLYGFKLTHEPVSNPRTIVKTTATLALCFAGIALSAPWIVILGLALGTIGDAFLSRDHSFGFLPGLGAFLCGHLIYLFWAFAQLETLSVSPWQLGSAAALTLCSAWFIIRWWSYLGALKVPVALYAFISLCLAITAIGFLGQGIGTLFAAGVLVFVMSDIILAEQLFVLKRDDPKYALYASLLWGLYWTGQLGILLGSLSFVS